MTLPPTSPMIELTGLTKRYGSFTAVNAIDLTVPAGELFGFLGPNGAGKTTTLRMIAGILKPTAGTVRIAGIDLAADPIAAKAVAPLTTIQGTVAKVATLPTTVGRPKRPSTCG